MAGAKIEVQFDDKEVSEAFARLVGLTRDFQPLLQRIGVGLVETTLQRFESATDPQGKAWHPLSRAYAARKKGPGILREKAMRGGLMGSITYRIQEADTVAVGSNKVYAAIHQFGGTFKREARTLTTFRKVNKDGKFGRGGRFVKKRLSNFSQTHDIGEHSMTMPARPYLGFGAADRAAAMEAVELTIGGLLKAR